MRRFYYSLLLSFACAWVGGLLLRRGAGARISGSAVLLGALSLSLILNLLFFYIRRWDGCIEKLGGLTFSLLPLAAATFPLLLLRREDPSLSGWVDPLVLILVVQTGLVGSIATVLMRTRNFKPPKPGEPLRW